MISRLYDLALVFGLFVAASGCGLWLLDRARLRAGGRIQQVCFATGLGLGLLGYVTFSLGMMSLLRQSFIAGAYVIVLFLGLRGWYSFLGLYPLDWNKPLAFFCQASRMTKALCIFVGLMAGINGLAALSPVIGVDELIYRLAAAKLYLRHESLFYIPSMFLHQQPQHVQMVQLWGMSLGSHSTAQVVQWGVGLCSLVVLIDYGRREMPVAWAVLGGALFYSYSDVIVLSGRGSADLANAFFMILALLAWLQWLDTGSGRWLGLAGLFAGLFAAGSRLPGAYGAMALVLLVVIYGRTRFRWPVRSAIVRGLAVGVLAFLIVFPWYGKSYLQTGNPFWPFFMPLLGARDWSMAMYEYVNSVQVREVGDWLTLERALTAPWDLTMTPNRFNSGVVGPLLLATLPLALLVRLPRRLRWILSACSVLAFFWYISFPRLRALIPALGLLSVVTAYLIFHVLREEKFPPWVRISVVGAIVSWLIIGFGTSVRFHLQAVSVTLGMQEETAYLSRRFREPDLRFFWYDDYLALNSLLPVGSRLLLYDRRGYHLDYDYDRYDVIAQMELQPQRLRDPSYVAEQVHKISSNYVVLWPQAQYSTAYAPSNWLEDSLYELCHRRWPIVYQSQTMIVCRVQEKIP
jgi:hypothetical protein